MLTQALFLLALYLPFGFALNPAAGVDLASLRLAVLVLFLAWLLSGLARRQMKIPFTLQTLFIVSFIGINILSLFVAHNSEWGMRKILFFLSLFPLYFVVADRVRTAGSLYKLVKYLLWGGSAAAAVGIFQFIAQFIFGLQAVYQWWAQNIVPLFLGKSLGEAVLTYPSWLVSIGGTTLLRATATFPDPHMFSFYLGMLAPLALGMTLRKETAHRMWYGASLLLIIGANLLTFSRGGYLGLAAGAVFLVIFFWPRLSLAHRFFLFSLAAIVAVTSFFPNPISQRFFSSFDVSEGSAHGRLVLWKNAWQAVKSYPLLGVGLGNFPIEINPTASYRDPIYAHNTYLDIAAESGLVNAGIWILLVSIATGCFLKKSGIFSFSPFAAASLVIFGSHSIFETGIFSPVVLSIFAILIALSTNASKFNEETGSN